MTSPITPRLRLDLLAQIFGIVSLKTGSVGAVVADATLAVERAGSAGVGTPLPDDEIQTLLGSDYPPEVVSRFLETLRSGALHGHRFDLESRAYRTDPRRRPSLYLPPEVIFERQNPTAPKLKARAGAQPSPPKIITVPTIPAGEDLSLVASSLLDPDEERLMLPHPGIVPITQPEILLRGLALIPKKYFNLAVYRALGLRNPIEGDRIAFTSDEGFVAMGCIKSLLVCPKIPKSRKERSFPKVWMIFQRGRWVILNSEVGGSGAVQLAHAVLTIPPWDLAHDGSPFANTIGGNLAYRRKIAEMVEEIMRLPAISISIE